MIFRNELALVPNDVLSAPLATSLPHVLMADKNGGERNFHFFHHKCLFQQFLLCTAVVYKEMPPRSDVKMCTHFIGINKEVPRRLSISDKEIALPCLRLGAELCQQQLSAIF